MSRPRTTSQGEMGPGMRRAVAGAGRAGPRAPDVILERLAQEIDRAAQALRYWDAAPRVRQKIRELYGAIAAERSQGEGEGGGA